MSLDKREELLPLVSSIRDKVKEDLFSADFKTIGRACDSIRKSGCLIRSLVCNNLLDNNKPMCPFSTDVQDPRIYPAYDLRWFQEVEEPWELGILVADFTCNDSRDFRKEGAPFSPIALFQLDPGLALLDDSTPAKTLGFARISPDQTVLE